MRRRIAGLSRVELAAAALLLAAAGSVLAAMWAWDFRFKDDAAAVQSLVTAAAIVVGGLLALRRFQLFRTLEPHLTITHVVDRRRVGSHYVHLDVTATLHNTSNVHVGLRDGVFALQQVSPISDEELKRLHANELRDGGLRWPTLSVARRDWDEGELVVEPGETHHETIEFIVSDHVETVIVYTYFFNPTHRDGSKSAQGWHALTVYDIVDIG